MIDCAVYHLPYTLASASDWRGVAQGRFPFMLILRRPACWHVVTLATESCLGFTWREAA